MNKGKTDNRITADLHSIKRNAKQTLRQHYLLLVVMCLIAVFFRAEFNSSDYLIGLRAEAVSDAMGLTAEEKIESQVYGDAIEAARQAGEDVVAAIDETDLTITKKAVHDIEETTEYLTNSNSAGEYLGDLFDDVEFKNDKINEVFGRSAGVLNSIIDSLTSDTIPSAVSSIVYNIIGSDSASDVVLIALATLTSFIFWVFVRRTYVAVMRRISLEARIYKRVPLQRYLFFIRVKRWFNAALTMSLMAIVELLWGLTIIGGIIMYYAYSMVPYIIAENPDIKPLEALKLSRRIMYGNKMKLFKADMSLIGWFVLGFITTGLSNIFFLNPYRVNIYAEFYAQVRQNAKLNSIEGAELLCDDYLFVKANGADLRKTYEDALSVLESDTYEVREWTGWRKKMADTFGIVLWNTPDENAYEESQAEYVKMLAFEREAEGESYPSRLFMIPETRKRRSLGTIHYMRHYSVLSVVLMFFLFSFAGWAWELVFYLVQTGKVINRGVLHGPWLPIYGAGGLLILIFLHWARRKPALHFFMTVILCGAVEYLGSFALEKIFGEKWWDYSGYFLNINGRICAEGLFVFGVAGLMFIYIIAPIIDDKIRKLNQAVLVPVAVLLAVVFIFDMVLSFKNPNSGDGITDNFADGVVRHEEVND